MSGPESAVVIGTGAAGRAVAKRLADGGYEVTAVEHDRVGGTCLWTGCIPKKALYAAARAVREVSRATQFGVECGNVSVDWSEVLAWKWHAQESFAGDQAALLTEHGIRLVQGTARFVSESQITIGEEQVSADHFVIATGSLPVIPEIPGVELADTSTDALRYPAPPRSLVILGGGFIAMELAGIFASFGTRVEVVQRGPRVLSVLDPALSHVAMARLSRMGVVFHTESSLKQISGTEGDLISTVVDGEGVSHEVACERAIVAIGRRPALLDLDPSAAGIELDGAGQLTLDSTLRTTNPRVWACGDAAGGLMHTPVASMEGRAVARSILSKSPYSPDYSAIPIACFTTPQLATVGLTAQVAEESGIAVSVHRIDSDAIGAAIVDDERDSFTQLVIGANDNVVLGAQIAGPTASDVIYAAAVAVKAHLTADVLQTVLGVHPSYAEAENYAAW